MSMMLGLRSRLLNPSSPHELFTMSLNLGGELVDPLLLSMPTTQAISLIIKRKIFYKERQPSQLVIVDRQIGTIFCFDYQISNQFSKSAQSRPDCVEFLQQQNLQKTKSICINIVQKDCNHSLCILTVSSYLFGLHVFQFDHKSNNLQLMGR